MNEKGKHDDGRTAIVRPSKRPVLPTCQNGKTISAMKTMTVKVPDELFAEIALAARTREVPRSEIVRERLSGKTGVAGSGETSLWSRMEDLVIATDSLPTDLSSNKAHLRGYGKKRSH
jgi:hypothetical protein